MSVDQEAATSANRGVVVLKDASEDNDTSINWERLGVDIDVSDTDNVWISMKRVRKIEGIQPTVTSLAIIACLLDSTEGVGHLADLDKLDLSQNRITSISPELANLGKLTVLDLSYNRIKKIENLENLRELSSLSLTNNELEEIVKIENNAKVRMLELGSNKIRVVQNLGHLVLLEELWLGRNKITVMDCPPLPRLRILSFQNNRLSRWPLEQSSTSVQRNIFEGLPELEELYVSENHLEGPPVGMLDCLTKLKTLDLSLNIVSNLDGVASLVWIEELWLNQNKISSLDEVRKIAGLKNLKTLYLEHNPLQADLGPAYRDQILQILPHLEQLDALRVK